MRTMALWVRVVMKRLVRGRKWVLQWLRAEPSKRAMQSIFDNGPWPPCPAPFNFAAHVLGRARDLPDKIALAVLGAESCENWSYAELDAAVRGTGTGLLQAGLKPGQIVLMRLGNNVEFPIAYLGAMAVGLVPVPTSTQLTEPEVAKMIDTLQPAAILHAEGVACPQTDIPVIDQDALEAMRALAPCEWDMGDPNRLAYVIFTSGTSGNARAVMHAHRAIWARGMMHEGWYGLGENDRLCHAGAFNWTYTLGTVDGPLEHRRDRFDPRARHAARAAVGFAQTPWRDDFRCGTGGLSQDPQHSKGTA